MTTPIDKNELKALRKLVQILEADLAQRALAVDLRADWQAARAKGRTALSFSEWRADLLTQIAVAWVLTAIFVRFLEDNGFIEPVISGQPARLKLARENQRLYFLEGDRGAHSDTDYLLHLFRGLAGMPAGDLFSQARNPLYRLTLSGDAASKLIAFFRDRDPDTGALHHDYTAEDTDTRFLGDLYQDLSESARKKYALLQTPDFVEEFILDRTLDPAIEVFGLDAVRFIDPTCGSGHVLLGGFARILARKQAARPGERADVLVREALEATHGVDINPFAVAIARFRLLIAALRACKTDLLAAASNFPLNVASGDSLVLGTHFPRFHSDRSKFQANLEIDRHRWDSTFNTEDNDLIFGTDPEGEEAGRDGILTRQYHAVVGNPPYITPKDPGARDTYREHYLSCSGKYALVCPFVERFFELAVGESLGDAEAGRFARNMGAASRQAPAGFVGLIVANSFMKRSFGKKLITEVFPNIDLTHVIDTSGAYIPGHGTPTVILFGRNQDPQLDTVRAVMGIRGEPSTPDIPAEGIVWQSVLQGIDDVEFENDYVSVDDLKSALVHNHPWSLQGGGATELKTKIENTSPITLSDISESIGFYQDTHSDEAFVQPTQLFHRHFITKGWKKHVKGESVRDWQTSTDTSIIFPFDDNLDNWAHFPSNQAWFWFWKLKPQLWQRSLFSGEKYKQGGVAWYAYHQFPKNRALAKFLISFAEIATHNHFVLDRGGKVFNRTAPIIKLPADATEDDHLGLLGLLNSSIACFYFQQIFHNKGGPGGARSKDEKWNDFYQHDSTKLKLLPVSKSRPIPISKHLDQLGQAMAALEPGEVLKEGGIDDLDRAREVQERTFRQMVAWQEELDWTCYGLYGLMDDPPVATEAQRAELPEIELGQRAFEIALARRVARDKAQTSWFERHGSTLITAIPDRWPAWYQELVRRRLALIAGDEEKGLKPDKSIRLIEKPEYKRRWSRDPWAKREAKALEDWLLARLESPAFIPQADREGPGAREPARLMTVDDLTHAALKDAGFLAAGERYTRNPGFEVGALVRRLVLENAVPALPAHRYKKEGMDKRREWEQVWALQRREDAIDARAALPPGAPGHLGEAAAADLKRQEVGDIAAPPKYRSADFASATIWRQRGQLDVPREAFIHHIGAEKEGDSPVVAWAGLDHLQQAEALANWYAEGKHGQDWSRERRMGMLAGLLELLPWVCQWHPEPDAEFGGEPFGDFLRGFIAQEAREIGAGLDDIEMTRMGAQGD